MARRRQSVRQELDERERAVLKGSPGDGDDFTNEGSPPEAPEKPAAKAEAEAPDPKEDVNLLILQELRQLRQVREQPVTRREEAAAEEDPFGDEFDKLVFEKPREAFQKYGDYIADKVTKKLSGQYQRDQTQRGFWDQFYSENPDLKDDRDLVDITLNSHMSELADMPADKAGKKLADLTRERILRYSRTAPKGDAPRKRAVAEGATGSNSPPAQSSDGEEGLTTLSDLIRARRNARRKAAAA